MVSYLEERVGSDGFAGVTPFEDFFGDVFFFVGEASRCFLPVLPLAR